MAICPPGMDECPFPWLPLIQVDASVLEWQIGTRRFKQAKP
jgi:hypothetical protein